MKDLALWKFFTKAARTLFGSSSTPTITENSSLRRVVRHYPEARAWLTKQYRVTLRNQDLNSSLKEFCVNHALPPPQVLFMEIQLAAKSRRIGQLSPAEAKALLDKDPGVVVLDVREPSEWCHHPGIPGALRCEEKVLREILPTLSFSRSLLLYCHFGVRSLDFAHWLADQGFASVFLIQGGLDAYSTQADPSIPRYDGSYC